MSAMLPCRHSYIGGIKITECDRDITARVTETSFSLYRQRAADGVQTKCRVRPTQQHHPLGSARG